MATIIIKYSEINIIDSIPLTKERIGSNTLHLKASCLHNFYPNPKTIDGKIKIVTKVYESRNGWKGGQDNSDIAMEYILYDTIENKVPLDDYNNCNNEFLVTTKVYNYNEQNRGEAKWYKIEWIINDNTLLKSTEVLNYEPHRGGGGGFSDDYWDTPGD